MIKFGKFLSIGGCVGVCRAVGAGFRPQLKFISSADDFDFVRRRNFFRLRCKYARARDTFIIYFKTAFGVLLKEIGINYLIIHKNTTHPRFWSF